MQTLYGRFFYTATVLVAPVWLGLLVLLMFAYYLNWAAKFRLRAGKDATLFLAATALLYLVIAAIQTGVHLISVQPSLWSVFLARPALVLWDPTFLPRFLHFVLAAVTMAAILPAAFPKALGQAAPESARCGLFVALVATGAQFAVGLWLLGVLPKPFSGLMTGGIAKMAPLSLGILRASRCSASSSGRPRRRETSVSRGSSSGTSWRRRSSWSSRVTRSGTSTSRRRGRTSGSSWRPSGESSPSFRRLRSLRGAFGLGTRPGGHGPSGPGRAGGLGESRHPRQPFDDGRNQGRGQVPVGASPENHLQLPAADLVRQPRHEIGEAKVAGRRQADIPVVALMSVEAEVPEEEVGPEIADPVRGVLLDQIDVDVVCGSSVPPALPRAGAGHVHFRPVRGLVIRSAETDMEDVGIPAKEFPRAVTVVGVRVHDREPPEAALLPQVDDAEGDVVEAAEASEVVPPRMMPAGADEDEGVGDFPAGDPLAGVHDAPRRMPCGRAEGVLSHSLQKIGRMDLQKQLLGHGLRFEQDRRDRCRESRPGLSGSRPAGIRR